MTGDLRHNMGRRTESIDAQTLPFARHLERAVSDQTRTQQGRRFRIPHIAWNRETIVRIGNRVLGVSPIDLIAGEARFIAEILVAVAAIEACAARMPKPRNPDPFTNGKTGHALSGLRHPADNFVPRNNRQFRFREIAVDHMQVRTAHAAGAYLDQNLTGAGTRLRQLFMAKSLARPLEDHCFHAFAPMAPLTRTLPLGVNALLISINLDTL